MHGDPKSRSAEGDNDDWTSPGLPTQTELFSMTTWEVLKSQGDASLLGMSESPWDGDCSRQTRLLPSAPDPGSPTSVTYLLRQIGDRSSLPCSDGSGGNRQS